MSDTQEITGTMLVTIEVPFMAEVSMDEYRAWSGRKDLDRWTVQEYLEADKDYPKNLTVGGVSPFMKVVSEEIERVEL